MLSDIKKYVIQGRMDSGSIYLLLIHDYPNYIIFKKNLYNAVYQFQLKNNPGGSNASQVLQILLNQKDLDPLWIVNPRLEPSSKKLNHLLWMSPQQRSLYKNFHDIIILNITSNTNQFWMMLCIIIVIDNHFKTRIVASVIIKDEILDTF
ncbi:protein FAR1-RELATED SEQUENCE 5-like [Rhizophagus irregularis DAOM 181602=DAOM 197198]|nr:protein FAR1-RELATED SEQUENCE 5-like [Rhizophagus irregularis DAOM 181602=DAOM 197198]